MSGIVDWESAGFMPEYWDYTKAMEGARNKDELAIYDKVWGNRFDQELKVEKCFWQGFPFGGPDEEEHQLVDISPTKWPRDMRG